LTQRVSGGIATGGSTRVSRKATGAPPGATCTRTGALTRFPGEERGF